MAEYTEQAYRLGGGVSSVSRKRRPATFRPGVEGLEERWCPATLRWHANAASNWTTSGAWQVWNAGTSTWDNTPQIPGSTDTAQFDGSSTVLCTVTNGQSVGELKISVPGNGSDQIKVAAGKSLSAKMVWSVDGVRINFGDSASTLTANGGSEIKAFTFNGAKGRFILPIVAFAGTTTWNTTADSTTTAQIDIEGGTFLLKGTGKITSSYGGYDVYVAVMGTLKFDYGATVTIADLLDNGDDGAGYIVTIYNSSTGAGGKVITSQNAFDVTNNMPIRNNGVVTVDYAKLTFSGEAGANTNGNSYYQPSTNIQASTTVLHGGTLGAKSGFQQAGGAFNIGSGGANISGGAGTLINFTGGAIKFPIGTDYETLSIVKGKLQINETTLNMKIDGQSSAQGHFDQVVCADTIAFANSTINVTVNGGLQAGLSWPLLVSTLGIDDITATNISVTPLNTFTKSIDNLGGKTYYDLNS